MSYFETVRALNTAWKAKKARTERAQGWLLFGLLRPLSFLVTPPFLSLGMTANQVTVLGWLGVVAAAVLYGLGGAPFTVAAGLTILVVYVLDLVDGNIARFRDARTHYGNYLDAVGDAIRIPLCLFGMAIGIHRHLAAFPWAVKAQQAIGDWIIMFAAGAFSFLYLLDLYLHHRRDRHAKWIELQKLQAGTAPAPSEPAARPSALGAIPRAIRRLFFELQIPVWVGLSVANRPDLLLAWSLASALFDNGAGIAVNIVAARRAINYPRP